MFYYVIISIIAMMVAQTTKLFSKYWFTREWDFNAMFSTGGMPSSHTALVTTLATSFGLIEGFGTSEFAITLVFGMVIAHDAMGIRYEAGKHASVINKIANDLSALMDKPDNPEEKLKDLLGHRPVEVIGGFLMGIMIALIGFIFVV
jgi:acid phosphatase family membrane protein YuiD